MHFILHGDFCGFYKRVIYISKQAKISPCHDFIDNFGFRVVVCLLPIYTEYLLFVHILFFRFEVS